METGSSNVAFFVADEVNSDDTSSHGMPNEHEGSVHSISDEAGSDAADVVEEEGSPNDGTVGLVGVKSDGISTHERSDDCEGDTSSVNKDEAEAGGSDEELRCGWFRIRPRWMQCFNRLAGSLVMIVIFTLAQSTTVNGLVYIVTMTPEKMFDLAGPQPPSPTCTIQSRPNAAYVYCFNRPAGFLAMIFIFTLAQSTTVNGLVYIVTTTLEKRFNLTSARSGSISSMYDLSVLIIIVFVTYLGERAHKPVWIARGAFLFGCGSFLFTLPHFLTEYYTYGSADEEVTCNATRPEVEECPEGGDEENLSNYYYVFVAAQILHGVGASPLYPLGQTYLYDNTKPRQVPVFLGVFQVAANFAPAIGFIGGGLLLTLYTDLSVKDEQTIDRSSPLWVGNWWLGFICTGTIAWLVAVPLSGFARRLPGTENLEDERTRAAQSGSSFKPSGFGSIDRLRDFPRAIFNLLKNIPCLCNFLGTSSEFFIIACISVFGPKFVESQFSLTAAEAAMFSGLVVVPSALGGVLLGGCFVKWFNWQHKGRMRFVVCSLIVGWAMMLCMLIRCPNIPFAGVTVKYENNTHRLELGESNITNECNANCHCGPEYDPVCGSNNVQYYTGCHAGCTVVDDSDKTKYFYNCSCVEDPVWEVDWQAHQGKCNQVCDLQRLFFFMVFASLFVAFAVIVPNLTCLLGVVDSSQRTLSLGVQSLFYRLLGTVPAPIIFGKLIDNACMIWETGCEGQKTCWVYQNDEFAKAMFMVVFVSRGLSVLFFSGKLFFYKPREVYDSEEETEEKIPPPSSHEMGEEVNFAEKYTVRRDSLE